MHATYRNQTPQNNMSIAFIKWLETPAYCFLGGLGAIKLYAMQTAGHIQRYFPDINTDLLTISSIVGLLTIIINAWIRFDKWRQDKKLMQEQIRALINKNNADEVGNYAFKSAIDGIPKDEFEESKKRISEK